ncbi:Aromatic peroxygenase [Leucoagaricus sp. SymC.cos]|nr:Aromatic peroxygenase [Leucoagaricus sp. SymC.cos]
MTNSQGATSYLPPAKNTPDGHSYLQARQHDSRSPCPALNTLANHGYIRRSGEDIGFFELIHALQLVYNLSWVLAFFLTFVGFSISGKVTLSTRTENQATWIQRHIPMPRWRLDLASLSIRGPGKIAHDASFVHPDFIPSHAPDPRLLARFLSFAPSCHGKSYLPGLSLVNLARYRQIRESELSSPLNTLHRQVALGECGLAWAVMRRRSSMERKAFTESAEERDEVITVDCLQKWFGCERLPDDWWNDGGSRPVKSIGLLEAKRRADHVAKIIGK